MNCEDCIECGECTESCVFLKKYELNLKDYAQQPNLAYHCYLCGECSRVCPLNLDGVKLSLSLRKRKLKAGYNLYFKGYGRLLLEKRNYIFKNYRNVKGTVAFFPGCNFPAYYPKTTKLISNKLETEFGISTIFDCCGKPIADLGMEKEAEKIKNRLNQGFKQLGIEELILLCPNCYYYSKDNLEIKVSTIYEQTPLMNSLIPEGGFNKLDGALFLPCPDRNQREILKTLEKYLANEKLTKIDNVQCCGAGGCAFIKEKELSGNLQNKFKDYNKKIYLYCATCAGVITKANNNVEHLLCTLLNTEEIVATGLNSVKNRAFFSLSK